ncbi:MAG: phosphatidylserine/phosphatidylglycerophosphate/cardiolipin synthase family protein [bacterium]
MLGDILSIGITLLVVAVLAFIYLTLSLNAESQDQASVVSVPKVASSLDAFMRAVGGAAGAPPSGGNTVDLYQNGDEIFPPMLAAIADAKSTVHFSTYVFWDGTIPDTFADAFSAAARRGLTVRVVLDSEGSSPMKKAVAKRMRDAGVHVSWFHRARWYDWARYNRRTHRRLLIVDGVVAFTGGVGIADVWSGHAQSAKHWRDTHVRITGPAVSPLQSAFLDNWNTCEDELLLNARDFPVQEERGSLTVATIVSSPSNGTSPAQRVMAACVAGAEHTLHITNPYFIPTRGFRRALGHAVEQGVDVKVIMPGPYHDQPVVRRASRHTWPSLLRRGVALYEYQPTMIHAKTLVVDDSVILVGSINFDPRSFSLNAEAGIVAADATLAARMNETFAADLAQSIQVTHETIAARRWWSRATDAVCYWIRAQL